MGLDVNGYDNQPEWGYCKTEGCKEEAYPIWKSGDYPDEPDLLLCPKHIGALIHSLSLQIGEYTTTIGYQDAMLKQAQADAAVLRQLIEQYLDDVEMSPLVLANGIRADHPGADLLAELKAARADLTELRKANSEVALTNASYLGALDAAYRALLSYAHGNTAPALAEEVAEKVLATIEKASGQ